MEPSAQTDTLTLYTDMRAFNILYPKAQYSRQVDIVFRCYLYEVCKMFKEYNIILKTIAGKEVEISEVVKKRIPAVFVWSRAGDHIRTGLHVTALI